MRLIPARFRCGVLSGFVAACLAVGVSVTAHAAQWADIATISSTLGNNAYRICTGGGATGLGCPGYAPLVGPSGDVTATGNMAASHFYGDGSGLTNLNLSGVVVDRIVSNTAGVYASNTGVVSIYGASGLAAYFDTTGQFVSGAISITTPQGISSTNGYFSGNIRGGADLYLGSAANDGDIWLMDTSGNSRIVFDAQNGHSFINTPAGYNFGIKTIVPSQTLHVVGSALITSWTGINFSGSRVTPTAPLEVSGTVSATAFVGDGSGLTNLNPSAVAIDRIVSGTAGIFVSNTGIINIRTGGGTTGYFDASGLLVAPGISITTANGISSTNGYFSGKVGIGTPAPQAAIHLYGDQNGAFEGLRLVNANSGNLAHNIIRLYNNSGASSAGLFLNSTARTADGGASGLVMYNDIGSIRFRSNAGDIEWATGPGGSSVTRMLLKTTGQVGIGVPTPTEELEVSGTVSATAFVGDGSGLTNLNLSGSVNDRITSGTAGVFVSNTGVINLRTGGATTGYFDTAGVLTLPGISTTGVVSAASLYLQPTYTHPFYGSGQRYSVLSTTNDFGNSFVFYGAGGSSSFGARNNELEISTVRETLSAPDNIVFRHFNPSTMVVSLLLKGKNGWVGVGSEIDPSQTLHVAGSALITSWTGVNFSGSRVTPTAPLEVLGMVSATAFVGDGSGLTNLNLSGSVNDRITSGTAGVFVSNTGVINLRTGGATTGYFDTAGVLVAPGVSLTATSGISSTKAYVSGILTVGDVTTSRIWTGTNILIGPIPGQSSGTYLNLIGYAGRYNTGNHVNAIGNLAALSNTGNYVNASGYQAARVNKGSYAVAIGEYALQTNSGSYVIGIGNGAASANTGNHVVAIGFNSAANNTFDNVVAIGRNAQPSKANQIVLGDPNIVEVSTAGVVLAAGVSATGTISATAFVGDGSGLTNLNLSGSVNDRITSGTAGVFVSSSGVINFRTGGTTTGYFDGSGLLAAPGISITSVNGISSTNGYFSGLVGIGATPSISVAKLIVAGATTQEQNLLDLQQVINNAARPILNLSKARGVPLAPSDVMQDDLIGTIIFRPYINGAYRSSVAIHATVDGTPSAASYPANLTFSTTGDNETVRTERMRITGSGLIGVGLTSPSTAFDVSGTISATAFVGNGAGLTNLPAANLSETISINDLSDASSTYASGNLFMGPYAASQVTGGSNNTAVGVLALASSTTGSYNTALGFRAMQNYTGTGLARNVAVGYRTMNQMATGIQNVAFGYDALFYSTAGNNNTAIGSAAMANALGNHNTAVGRNALYNNAYGDNNVAVGMEVAAGTPSTSQYISTSVLVGSRAGYTLGYAQYNVLLGYRAGYTMTGGNYNIVIGTDTTMPYDPAGSYQLNLGNALYGDLSRASTQAARLGINVLSPTATLEVSGTVSATLVQVSNKTPPSSDCDDATDYGKLGLDPVTFQPRMCLPR